MLQINNKILHKEYNSEYLLQVWSREGKLVFQRALHKEVKVWGISNEFLIYKPLLGDENSEYYHVTNLKNGNSTLLVRDCINDASFTHLAFHDNVLYAANKSTIYILDCQYKLQPGEVQKRELEENQIQKVVPGLKIHGMFIKKDAINKFFWKYLVIVAMETDDNQLDFSQISISGGINTKNFKCEFKQLRELVQRDVTMDPIQNFKYVINEENVLYGIALRQSGHFDIYWNMTIIDSPMGDRGKTYKIQQVLDVAVDIKCSFDSLYFKMKSGEIKAILNKQGSSIHFEQALTESEEFQFSIVFYQKIKNYGILKFINTYLVNLFNSFTLIRTTLYIVHGQYVSLYNIQESQWIKHCKFEEGRIFKLFKKEFTQGTRTKLEIAVLLENGSLYNNMQTQIFAHKHDEGGLNMKLMKVDSSKKTLQLNGKMLKTSYDQQFNKYFYIMTKEQEEGKDKVKLYAFYNDKQYEVKEGLLKDLDEYTNFVQVCCPQDASDKQHLLLQKHSDVYLYQMSFQKPQMNEQEVESALGQVLEEILVLECVMNQNLQNVKSDVHSCISTNINDHFILVDNHNMYKYLFKNQTTKIYKDQNCVGMFVVDEKFCYSLSHSSKTRSSGLRLYDLAAILSKDTDVSCKLSNIQVGFQGHIDWNHDYSRFSILKSLDSLMIVPALHRNNIAFIGMNKRDSYIATKKIKDKFIALDNKNYLFCWSVVSGKLLCVNKLPTRQDYTQFKLFSSHNDKPDQSPYNREWYQKVLIVKKEQETDFDESGFYYEEGLTTKVHNQIPFAKSQKKDFREFRLIEIINENEVKEHLTFIHPLYHNEKQRLYFDAKSQLMIEKLSHPRVFLYEKEESKMKRTVKWRCIKRLQQFPEDLENDSGFMRTMSPTFTYYIDLNRSTNQFVIKDTITSTEMIAIPKHLMNLAEESVKVIMNRFTWINDDTIRLLNKEGIEQLLDLKDNCISKEFNIVPLFNNHDCTNPLISHYHNRPSLAVSQVKERLIRKYQQYKSSYYLEHKREAFSLYDEIFTVDYQVQQGKGMHVADMSFTFLHWKLMELLSSKQVPFDLIDKHQMELLCYNILPGGNTILHQLCHSSSEMIQNIFKTAHPNEENIAEQAFHIPFIPNLQHKSPMHICKEQQDIRTMDTMLTYLAGYEIDHHSRAIVDLIPFIIDKQLPSFLPYLDSRLQQTDRLKALVKGCLDDNSDNIAEMSLWFGQEELVGKVFKKQKEGDEASIDTAIRVQYIDMPRVYHYEDELCNQLFTSLADTDQYEIFAKKAIQKMIEFNYPLVKEWTIRKLFIPFMLFQATLYIYLNLIFRQTHFLAIHLDFPMQILLGVFACYFLQNEFTQMKNDGLDYLSSVWNYIDIITPSTILTVLLINTFEINIGEEQERILQAIGVFFMWFKFLYFFRIFKSFGYLTRLIILVVIDMRHFLIVLFITLVAFGDTFLTISNGNNPAEGTQPFVNGFFDSIMYTYLIVLGAFEMSHFQESIATNLLMGFFIMCTVFNTIVMLNLLIAIISETFSMVKENAENASYQEMASMISENGYLIPDRIKDSYAEKNRYLMIVSNLTEEMDEANNSDEILTKIEMLKKNMNKSVKDIHHQVYKVNSRLDRFEEMWEKQEFMMHRIMFMLSNKAGSEQNLPRNGSQYDLNAVNDMMTNSRMTVHMRNSVRQQMQQNGRTLSRNMSIRQTNSNASSIGGQHLNVPGVEEFKRNILLSHNKL